MPSVSLAVDGSARTFNCVAIIPSTEEVTGVSTEVIVSRVAMPVCVDGGIGVAGRVAVTKSGVAVANPLFDIFTLQLVYMIITAMRVEIVLYGTSQLYLKNEIEFKQKTVT